MVTHGKAQLNFFLFSGSLPPSPADSGVSDVDSSSSGHTSNDELKARLQPGPGMNLFNERVYFYFISFGG